MFWEVGLMILVWLLNKWTIEKIIKTKKEWNQLIISFQADNKIWEVVIFSVQYKEGLNITQVVWQFVMLYLKDNPDLATDFAISLFTWKESDFLKKNPAESYKIAKDNIKKFIKIKKK